MILAFTEREEAKHLMATLPALIFGVAVLDPELPAELDALECCEIIARGVLRFQLERLRCFFQIQFTCRRVHAECADEVEDDITAKHFAGFATFRNNVGFGLFARYRGNYDLVGAIVVTLVDRLCLNQILS